LRCRPSRLPGRSGRRPFRRLAARSRPLANATHGVPRTNGDKRRAVMKLLHGAEWSHWSDREIARHAKVDNKTVSRLREEIAPKVTEEILSEPRTFTTKHGTTAKMKTGKIGVGRTPSTHSGFPGPFAPKLANRRESGPAASLWA